MNILLVHNLYGSDAPSGENQVVEAERELLRANGHAVAEFSRYSDEIRRKGSYGLLRGAFSTPWNPWTARAVRRAVEDHAADVVHVHNTFPLISPSIFYAIGRRAARVVTLHNYRLVCPAAIPMRDGDVCTQCIDKRSVLPSLRYGCYRDSRLATAPLALNVALHRRIGTWHKQVDAFIALSNFQRDLLVKAGLPRSRLHTKPNFFPGRPVPIAWDKRDACAVFVGRLTPEKGVEDLLRAWLAWGDAAPVLKLFGDGPLRNSLQQLAARAPRDRIQFRGQVAPQVAQEAIGRARLLVLPSRCFEGFPMVLREAFAMGTPAAVSALGPLPSIVEEGVSGANFVPGDPASLLATVQMMWHTPGQLQLRSQGAYAAFVERYTEEANYSVLIDIYKQAAVVSGQRS